MGLAAKMGVRPFVLAEPLQADIVIGFDVNGFDQTSIGAVTLDGASGDVITQTTSGFSAGRSTAAPEFETKSALRCQIEDAVQEKEEASSIVIHRDGTLKNREESAIRELIPALVDEGTLPEDVRWGVVEVNEDPAHRIFDPDHDLRAPTGTYTTLGRTTGLVVNGGHPYVPQGTPKVTLCTVAATNSDWDIAALTQDVFRLSFLNWGSPGSVNTRSPITTDLATELAKMFEKCNDIHYLPF
jgi:argonaute-like protein implicated in RNA metabolism and viral defense